MTVQEALLQSGFTKEQIDALDPRALTTFGGILTSAEQKEKEAREAAVKAEADRQAAAAAAKQAEEARVAAQQAREAAELEKRSNVEFYETKVMPGLIGYEDEKKALETAKINAEAAAAFYKAQNEAARTAGFVPTDSPAFTPPATPPPNQPRDGNGRFVPGTSGSPNFVSPEDFFKRVDTGVYGIQDIGWKYQSLYGRPIPISPSELVAKADALKLSPMEYAARTFKFAEKEEEQRQAAAKAHDDEIRNAAAAEKAKEYEVKEAALRAEFAAKEKERAERMGNNPDVRAAQISKIADVRKAVQAGELPDPLKMTDAQRRAATRQQIHKDLSEREGAVA